jgi:UDP-N-acetylglucosamine:LPS N-acetylglucosamine transferase
MRPGRQGTAEILLACSSGGHLFQLLALRGAWEDFTRVWVTDDTTDARSLLRSETVVFAHTPTTRNLRNLFRNLWLAWGLVGRVRPRVVLTTGAGTAVPFAWVGRLRGAHVVYVESVTRIDAPSLSCRLVRPAADRVYVQWPDLQAAVPGSRYAGTVLGR